MKLRFPSGLVTAQASAMAGAALESFRSVKRQVELLGEVYRLLARFFATLGGPMMRLREALPGGPPWSEDYNDMLREVHGDLAVLTGETALQKKAIVEDFNFAKTENLLLLSKLSSLEDRFRDAALYHGSRASALFARDSFDDTSKIDPSKIAGEPVEVDTQRGYVSLRRTGSAQRQAGATIEIVPGTPLEPGVGFIGSDSNGFPGNLHELTIDPSSINRPLASDDERFRFVGEDNPHSDWSAVIDGDPGTWFEYELVNLDQKYKDEAKGYGFAFDVPGGGRINWARDPEGGRLKLRLRITLPEPALVNWISVRLYTPPNPGARPAVVDDLRVSRDGVAVPESILSEAQRSETEAGDLVYSFSPRTVKTLDVYFFQDSKFDITVGHIYYKRIVVKRSQASYLFGLIKGRAVTETIATRVDGPNMPVTALGVTTVNPMGDAAGALTGAGALVYAAAHAGTALGLAGAAALGPIGMGLAVAGLIIGGLYSRTVEVLRDDVEAGVEAFPGWRWAIGVADITLNTYTFAERGEFVSVPYTSHQPIRSVSLRTVDYVPEAFGEGRWVRYYVSVDDGASWHEISPMGSDRRDAPEVYRINSRELPSTRDPRVGYIEAPGEVYSVRLKAVLERPPGNAYKHFTPLIYDYVLMLGL